MRDLVVARFWISLVFLLNHIPFGPRYDLVVNDLTLEDNA